MDQVTRADTMALQENLQKPKPVPKAPEEPSIVVLERTPPSASASVLRSRTQQLEQQAKEALKDVQTQAQPPATSTED